MLTLILRTRQAYNTQLALSLPLFSTHNQVNQWTALILATRQGNLKMVKALLDHGADLNAQNSVSSLTTTIIILYYYSERKLIFYTMSCIQTGISSLSLAVYEHHTEIAMLMVHKGAEVNIVEEVNNGTSKNLKTN